MKEPQTVSIGEALADLARYDAILDARSPAEFELDHLPGASSTPVLDDRQRIEVGTLHAEQGSFVAKRRGAALVSRSIAALLDGPLAGMPPTWRPLVYCWRGGNRSSSLATVLARVGWRVDILEGGYRSYRRQVVADLAQWPADHRFIVIAGPTGSGKSRLLQHLGRLGLQVLDLEALAEHRGSVLGPVPDRPQPAQKAFESRIRETLAGFDRALPIFVESESRKIGQCHVPEALIARMRESECVVLDASVAFRTRLLIDDYEHFVADPVSLGRRLSALVPLHGHERIEHWIAQANAGDWNGLVGELLADHYDPSYRRSMARNFSRLREAWTIPVCDGAADATGVRFAPAPDDALAAAAERIAQRYRDRDPAARPGIMTRSRI